MKSPKELAQEVLGGFKSCDFSYDIKVYIIASAMLKLEEEKELLVEAITKVKRTEITHGCEECSSIWTNVYEFPALTEALSKVTGEK